MPLPGIIPIIITRKQCGSPVTLNMDNPKRQLNEKRIGLALWSILFLLLVAIHFYPIRFGTLRLLMVVGVLALWSGALWLLWPHKAVRRTLLTASTLFIAFLLCPSRPSDPQTLRQQYVRSLKSYDGTTYVWGGESRSGIDCSGLVRSALIDANVKQGLTTANPSALREGLALWWNDCSAKALKDTYRGRTRLLFTAPSLNQLNDVAIQPGDIAVTSSGVHVLAYVGNQTWIEADPSELRGDKVVQVKTPTRIAWFNLPVHMMRWRQLEAG